MTGVLVLGAAPAGAAKPLGRPADPVVVTGADVPRLLGEDPGRIVAFGYSKKRHRWDQVPVQVDERTSVDMGQLYDDPPDGVSIETYADPGTFTGPDSDPTLDADDEIALMARDAGKEQARRKGKAVEEPSGVRSHSGVRLKLSNPDAGSRAFVYLFASKPGRRDPAAGEDLVDYRFNLLSGDYRSTYRLQDGPNPEDSTIATDSYALRFTDRWINDVLTMRAGEADGRDVIDRRNAQFAPGNCGRSVDTFTDAEGAFIVNKDGPVRAIRAYIGANSGPLTERDHIFYDRQEQVTTYLRVHPISGVMDFWDYSPDATGMTYRSSTLLGGVPVDGSPDPVGSTLPTWEQLSGPQGTLTQVNRAETDVSGLSVVQYYLDQANPNDAEERQCTGDGQAFATSGSWTTGSIPNTDPRSTPAATFTGHRTIFFDAPGQDADMAAQRAGWVDRPLAVSASPFH